MTDEPLSHSYIHDVVIPEIAQVIFISIQPEAEYAIIRVGAAVPFTTQRLLRGLPASIVGDRDNPAGRPIRDHGIYRIVEAGQQHNDILSGWRQALEDANAATFKRGQDITVDEIWTAATADVLARLDTAEDP